MARLDWITATGKKGCSGSPGKGSLSVEVSDQKAQLTTFGGRRVGDVPPPN